MFYTLSKVLKIKS